MQADRHIRQAALDLGFCATGIARVRPSPTLPLFDQWLTDGCAATMDYLSRRRDLRADPRLLFSAARSIVAVAARYPVHPQPGQGFSRYASCRDYHDVLRERLALLAREAEKQVGPLSFRICVDSAPLLERAWALEAGIGWRGMQGQVIIPEGGACTFLGFLLIDADLDPTPPVSGGCGSCTRCRDACPAGAIRENGLVDARRCVSYLTIEHKGLLPEAQRASIGESLFGCDRCTAVCPWNDRASGPMIRDFETRPMPTAEACVHLPDADFRAQFADTPVCRAGAAKLRDTAAAVLANRSSRTAHASGHSGSTS